MVSSSHVTEIYLTVTLPLPDHFCLSSQQLFALPYISLHFPFFFQRNISASIQGIPPLKALTVLIVPLQVARLCVKQSWQTGMRPRHTWSQPTDPNNSTKEASCFTFLFFFLPIFTPTDHYPASKLWSYFNASDWKTLKVKNTYWGFSFHNGSNGWESDTGLQSRDNVVLSAIQLYCIVLIPPYCQVSRPARLDSSAWLANDKDVQLSRPQPRWMWVTPFVSFWHLGGSSGLALWSRTFERIL